MKGLLFIILAAFLWAVDTLYRYPLMGKGLAPLQIVFIEHLFLCLFFLPVFFTSLKKLARTSVAELFYFFVIGFMASGIGTLTFTKAMGLINPSLVIILQKFQPIIAIGLARVVLGEKTETPFWRWTILCLLGGLLISSNDLMAIKDIDFSSGKLWQENAFKGYALTLCAACCWGAATVFGKKLTSLDFSTSQVMMGRFYAAFLGLLPLAVSTFEFQMVTTHGKDLLIMVAVSGVLGMGAYYFGLKQVKAKLATLAEMFFPFFAIILNWIFLGASLNMVQIAGACFLLIGSFMIQYKRY
jgi:drug/metabolite transporter (DMT)-like permease